MKICYFGIYDSSFSRNKVYRQGFKHLGVEVIECRNNAPGLKKYLRLWSDHRKIKNNYDAIIVGYPGHLVVPLARLISKKPVIADLLGSMYDAEKHSHGKSIFHLFKLRLIDRLAIMFADKVLLESESQKKYFEETFGKSDKYAVVYTGADEEVFGLDRKPVETVSVYGGNSDGKFQVLFRGKFTPECGIASIIRAAEILKEDKNITFKFLGRGYLLPMVESMIKEKNLTNIELTTKYLSLDEMRSSISGASLYLGQFEENDRLKRTIPHKLFEALALGVPYLSSDKAVAAQELIVDGKTGFITSSSDEKIIADKIRYLSKNPDLLKTVAGNGRALYESKLSPTKLAERIISLIP